METTDPKIIAALIAAAASLIVSIIGTLWGRKNQKDLETLKSELADERAESDARRDYEYDARKRLYEECEPLLFQLIELSENALYRIYSLARTARNGNLAPETGWLSSDGSYYLISTIYNLMAPMVIYKLIHRRLTIIDLTVDSLINMQYLLAKYLNISFTEHHALAKEYEPIVEYEPDTENWDRKRKEQPWKYWRQGLAIGRLDNAVEALIVRDSAGHLSYRSFGEFESEYFTSGSELQSRFAFVVDLFHDFHPKTRPVLWRILILQAHICQGIMRTRQMKIAETVENFKPLKTFSTSERQRFDWRQPEENVTDDEVLVQPFEVAKNYLQRNLGALLIE